MINEHLVASTGHKSPPSAQNLFIHPLQRARVQFKTGFPVNNCIQHSAASKHSYRKSNYKHTHMHRRPPPHLIWYCRLGTGDWPHRPMHKIQMHPNNQQTYKTVACSRVADVSRKCINVKLTPDAARGGQTACNALARSEWMKRKRDGHTRACKCNLRRGCKRNQLHVQFVVCK